jgi:hypothetical protein
LDGGGRGVGYGHKDVKGLYPELLSAELKPRLLSQTCPRRNAAPSAGGSGYKPTQCDRIIACENMNAAGARFFRRQLVGKNGNICYIFSLGRIKSFRFWR